MNSVEREVKFHVGRAAKGKKQVRDGAGKKPKDKVPRIARLMALAIHFDGLIREGRVKNYAEIARLGGVTRAHVTHMMMLLNLAPGIQEQLLSAAHPPLAECLIRGTSRILAWSCQILR